MVIGGRCVNVDLNMIGDVGRIEGSREICRWGEVDSILPWMNELVRNIGRWEWFICEGWRYVRLINA